MTESSILFLSAWFPYPADNGSKLRILNVTRQLAREYRIALVSLSPEPDRDRARIEPLLRFCHHVQVAQQRRYQPRAFRSLLGLLSPVPRSLRSTFSEAMAALVHRELGNGSYDLLIASQFGTILYALQAQGIPRLLEEAEVGLLASGRRPGLRGLRHHLTLAKLGAFLRRHASHLSWTVASEAERANLLALAPNISSVAVIPNGVEIARYLQDYGEPEPDTLIYPGALTFDANLDAMDYFVRQIFPRVRQQRPAARVRITGDTAGVPTRRLPAGDGVELTGYLPDIRPAIARSAVCVCPLRLGGGSRLKLLEAMALGTPVVATSRGAEGLDVTPEEHLLIADDPQTFADRVVELLASPKHRRRLGARGRELVQARYDWEVIGRDIRGLVARLLKEAA